MIEKEALEGLALMMAAFAMGFALAGHWATIVFGMLSVFLIWEANK